MAFAQMLHLGVALLFGILALYIITIALLLWFPGDEKVSEDDRYDSAVVALATMLAVLMTMLAGRVLSWIGELLMNMTELFIYMKPAAQGGVERPLLKPTNDHKDTHDVRVLGVGIGFTNFRDTYPKT